MPEHRKKWLIVFLIYADFRVSDADSENPEPFAMSEEMKIALNRMFKDILTVPLNASRARLFVLMNGINYQAGSKACLRTATKTILYEVKPKHNGRENYIQEAKLIDSDEETSPDEPNPKNPLQNPDFLKQVLKQNIKVFESEEVFFITWDHGSAFGIFREEVVSRPQPEVISGIDNSLEEYPYLREFWEVAINKNKSLQAFLDTQKNLTAPLVKIANRFYVLENNCNKDSLKTILLQNEFDIEQESLLTPVPQRLLLAEHKQNNTFKLIVGDNKAHLTGEWVEAGRLVEKEVREILSNKELAEIIKHWLPEGRNVGVLMMMNCWMMNLHTMYSLRDCVECLVAPQGDIGSPGYNYKDILMYIHEGVGRIADCRELAITCVRTSENARARRRAKKLRPDKPYVIDTWKIFAMDLQRKVDNELIFDVQLKRLREVIGILNPDHQKWKDRKITSDEIKKAISFYQHMRLVAHDFTKQSVIDLNVAAMVDIINWLKTLRSVVDSRGPLQPPAIPDFALNDLRGFLDNSGINALQNPLLLSVTKGTKVYHHQFASVHFTPIGYSLFFPQYRFYNQNVITDVRKDSFLDDDPLDWKKFIKTVYNKDVWGNVF